MRPRLLLPLLLVASMARHPRLRPAREPGRPGRRAGSPRRQQPGQRRPAQPAQPAALGNPGAACAGGGIAAAERPAQVDVEEPVPRSRRPDQPPRRRRCARHAGHSGAARRTPTVQDKPPAVYGDKGAIAAQTADERAAYDAAFSALKAGQYAQSAELFQSFLQQYPNGSYTPNALYWLGESYYVTQNYPLAQEQFQTLLDHYPTHDKAPGALLKVGLSQYGARQYDAAERTLSEVANRYPGTDAARTAADRLSAIQLGQLTPQR